MLGFPHMLAGNLNPVEIVLKPCGDAVCFGSVIPQFWHFSLRLLVFWLVYKMTTYRRTPRKLLHTIDQSHRVVWRFRICRHAKVQRSFSVSTVDVPLNWLEMSEREHFKSIKTSLLCCRKSKPTNYHNRGVHLSVLNITLPKILNVLQLFEKRISKTNNPFCFQN